MNSYRFPMVPFQCGTINVGGPWLLTYDEGIAVDNSGSELVVAGIPNLSVFRDRIVQRENLVQFCAVIFSNGSRPIIRSVSDHTDSRITIVFNTGVSAGNLEPMQDDSVWALLNLHPGIRPATMGLGIDRYVRSRYAEESINGVRLGKLRRVITSAALSIQQGREFVLVSVHNHAWNASYNGKWLTIDPIEPGELLHSLIEYRRTTAADSSPSKRDWINHNIAALEARGY